MNPFEFFFDCRKQVQVTSNQIRWIVLVWHAVNAIFFRANLLNPDFCEQSNCRQKSPVVFRTMPFCKERSFVLGKKLYLSRNGRYSFWYHLEVCRQHRTQSDSI
jgi:hypothetical protein